MQNSPVWDLSDLFSSIDDPKIDKLLKKSSEKALEFKGKYRGKIGLIADPSEFLEAVRQYELILSETSLPYAFAELIFTVDSTSSENGAFLQKIKTQATEIFSELIFFELEVGLFSQETIEHFMESDELNSYKHYFERILADKPYKLSELEEKILEMKKLTGKQAIARLFEQELSRQKFEIEMEGKNVEMNQSEILNILYSSDNQQVRQKAFKSFTEGILKKESIFTFVINTLAEDKKINDKLRGFSFPEQSRHLQNEADPAAIEAMCKVVEESYEMVQEYYKFKKQVLGLEKMYDCDRYAPLGKTGKEYSFQQAKEIVLSAFKEFNPRFEKIANDFFEKSWIHANPGHGKRGGAYCECASPDMHPYVFMNFTGSANDVMTLAHELGHAIHFELSRKQSFVNYNCPLTLAETASIFAETLTFSKLISDTDDKEVALGLYMQKIESIIASVHRQISMYRFEQDFHGEFREKSELSRERINQLWRNSQEKMFGDAIILTDDYDNWWMYISHFVATPFYVYAYAFGELLAFGFLEKIKNNAEFVDKYIDFLSDAGLKSPQQLADPFGIRLDDEKFWESGIFGIEKYLEKAKELYSQIEKQK